METALRWLVVLGGGALALELSRRYHLQNALFNPLLPYLVGTLLFGGPLEAGVAFCLGTSVSTVGQITAAGVSPAEVSGRLLLVGTLAVLIVGVKRRLRQRNKERLRLIAERGTQRLQAVLDAAPEPMLVVDAQATIVLANTRLEHLAGSCRAALVGQSVEILVPPRERARHRVDLAGYIACPRARPMGQGRELEMVRADGSILPVEISLLPYHDDERLLVVVAVVDISVRREMERQRVAALVAAEDAERRAQASEKRAAERSAFMSAAAHELRTPLTAMRGYTEIALSALLSTGLLQQQVSSTQDYAEQSQRIARALPAIARQTEKLERMVGLLLDVGRLEQGRVTLDLQRGDLAALVREVAHSMQPSDPDHPLNVGAVEGCPPLVFDALRIEQVLNNLLRNAQQYSPPGSAITVVLHEQDGGVLLTVSDEGAGIPPDQRALVFERFYQIGRTERSQGLGLGLYLVKMFVQMHGGWVRITDGPHERGTAVQVWLPLRPPGDT